MLIAAAEAGLLPDPLIRFGIRRLVAQRLREEAVDDVETWRSNHESRLAQYAEGPVAIETDAANEQHYEVPADFFTRVLGHRRKYSSCYFETPDSDLNAAEDASLRLSCEHADLVDGQAILELGCGWGSLTLWMAEHYPNASITAVSNSASQREFIMAEARRRGLDNIRIITANMTEFEPDVSFDRVVSIEMFEHMRNHRELLRRIAGWLRPGGKLFVHVFCHRHLLYPFTVAGEDDWMAQYFFTGGIMPSLEMLTRHQEHLKLEDQWQWNGKHYEATANAWLDLLDRRRDEVEPILESVYGSEARRWLQRWRMFFMACAELFGYQDGEQWLVAHYRFVND